MKYFKGLTTLLGLVVSSGILACNPNLARPIHIESSYSGEKIESSEKYERAIVVGRNYVPSFNLDSTVKISYGNFFNEHKHNHSVPVHFSQPEHYFLFVEINSRTFIKEVNKITFRDAREGSQVMVKYTETRKVSYKPNTPELEKINDEFNDLSISEIKLIE